MIQFAPTKRMFVIGVRRKGYAAFSAASGVPLPCRSPRLGRLRVLHIGSTWSAVFSHLPLSV
jgi:hypothetical protein